MNELAYTLQGEAGGCANPVLVMAAIAWMMHRQPLQTWYGWAEPGLNASIAARWYYWIPDPTPGALFCFSEQDLTRKVVQDIIAGLTLLRRFHCAGGLSLYFYGKKEGGGLRKEDGDGSGNTYPEAKAYRSARQAS